MTHGRLARLARLALAAGAVPLSAGVSAQPPADTPIEVVVRLSPAAAARLANPKETIIVDAEFFGEPISRKLDAEYQGRFDVAPERTVELLGAGTAHIPAPQYDPRKLRLIRNEVVSVQVEIYSGRHSSPDNLLDCGFFEDRVQVAMSKPVLLNCKLIGEK
jgi:hypothetical protein